MIPRSHHDMGGLRAGKVKPVEHDYADWERRIDAMAVLLWGLKGTKKHFSVDEHRKNIESLPPELYDALTYYEKWIVALAQCLIQRGVITSAELGKRMKDAAGPRMNHDMGGVRAKKVKRTEHDYEEWERRVDAMAVLLREHTTVDERRRAIETLAPEDYDELSYYERWIMSLATVSVQRGLVTTAELARKMSEVRSRA